MQVTGDHPVFVHTVKPEGAAYLAGVRAGDRILKVNGMPVTSSNHLEVVRMISGACFVQLRFRGCFLARRLICSDQSELRVSRDRIPALCHCTGRKGRLLSRYCGLPPKLERRLLGSERQKGQRARRPLKWPSKGGEEASEESEIDSGALWEKAAPRISSMPAHGRRRRRVFELCRGDRQVPGEATWRPVGRLLPPKQREREGAARVLSPPLCCSSSTKGCSSKLEHLFWSARELKCHQTCN